MIIIMRFGVNVLCSKYIDIYEFLRVRSTVHFLFIIKKKMEKVQEHDLYLNQILHFELNFFFPGWIEFFLWKGGPAPISLRSEYSSSNWFHSNTPNSRHFLIQIVNTNMYLIHFHSKNNITMLFPKSCIFKGSNTLQAFIIHRNRVK